MTALGTLIGRGVTGSKPAAGTAGALYYDTTLGQLQRDNGSTWDVIEAGGELTGTDLNLTGLTGATAGFKFIGAVASGAPASGTHVTNDVALDIAGKQWYVCTAGGTPGTWVVMGGGGGSGAMTLITDTLLTGTAASIVFSSIPGTYKHLLIYGQARCDASSTRQTLLCRYNGDTAANYEAQWHTAANTATSGVADTGTTSMACGDLNGATAGANMPSTHEILIPNYAATTFEKQQLVRSFSKTANSGSGVFLRTMGGAWRSTAAITSVTLLSDSGLLIAGTRFSLYGVN